MNAPAIFNLREILVEAGAVANLRQATAAIKSGNLFMLVRTTHPYWIRVANPDATLLLTTTVNLRMKVKGEQGKLDTLYLTVHPKEFDPEVYFDYSY